MTEEVALVGLFEVLLLFVFVVLDGVETFQLLFLEGRELRLEILFYTLFLEVLLLLGGEVLHGFVEFFLVFFVADVGVSQVLHV